MTLLGIETSCDETSAAVITGDKDKLILKSQVVASSLALHAITGGVIPENAAREQLKYILPVINEALQKAEIKIESIDAIAVTYGPGLIGSLLVGVETAKTLAYVLDKPLIPVNHMVGHIYANFITPSLRGGTTKQSSPGTKQSRRLPRHSTVSSDRIGSARNDEIRFPAIALVVSGGHTDLLLLKAHGKLELLGGTRDDAAGEAFDKIGRLLGLPYPAGPVIEKLAKEGNPKRFRFPRPLIGSDDYEFSFSGLKTAVLREVQKQKILDEQTVKDLACTTQDAIIDVLTKKTLKAAKQYNVKSILLSGGVAANETLRNHFLVLSSPASQRGEQSSVKLFAPAKSLCTDNAAMIAAAAYYNYKPVPWSRITANPELYFEAKR